MGGLGQQPAREILQTDCRRAETTRRGVGYLEAVFGRGRVDPARRLITRIPTEGGRYAEQIEDGSPGAVAQVTSRARAGRGTTLPHRTADRAEHPAGDESGGGALRGSQGFRRGGAGEGTEPRH